MTSRLEREKTALENAEKRLRQAIVRRDNAAAKLRSKQRKAETRAKIILGAALMALIRNGHRDAQSTVEAVLAFHAPQWPERDRTALTEALRACQAQTQKDCSE